MRLAWQILSHRENSVSTLIRSFHSPRLQILSVGGMPRPAHSGDFRLAR